MRITNSNLVANGRFGNQVYQYLFLKVYARRHGLTVETPDWVGNQLFGLNDPRISTDFCQVIESKATTQSYSRQTNKVFVNRDFLGWFQIHTSHHRGDEEFIRSLFKPTPAVERELAPAINFLRSRGQTLIAIHLRRGDFGSGPFIISPAQWYVTWLRENWARLNNPVIFIASDSLDQVLPAFAEFHPLTMRDLNLNFSIQAADFYPEFYILSQADISLLSNSTFSTATALLNERASEFYRPDFENKTLKSFDPWNTESFESWHRAE
jgi:hypothetical protein